MQIILNIIIFASHERMVFHILSKEADLKDTLFINNGESITDTEAALNSLHDEEIVLFMTDFTFELTIEFRNLLESFGFSPSDLELRCLTFLR